MQLLGIFVALIEWYDAAICISFANVMSEIFLPEVQNKTQLTLYLYLIGSTYLGRPLGAYLIGKYSDKISRIKAAYISFFSMVLASLVLSMVPCYKTLGILSPILFFIIKLIQGIAIGGNYGVSVYSIEKTEKDKQHFLSSLICLGIIGGFTLGSLTTYLFTRFCSEVFILNYSWRIALIGSSILSIPVFFCFPKIDAAEQTVIERKPSKFNLKLFLKWCMMLTLDIVPFYIFFTFLPNYKVIVLKADASNVWLTHALSTFTIVIFTPIFGFLSDKFNAKNILRSCCIFLMLSSPFALWDSLFWDIFLGVTMAMCYGSLYSLVALSFKEENRAISSGLALNLVASIINLSSSALMQIMEQNIKLIGLPIFLIGIISLILLNGKIDEF